VQTRLGQQLRARDVFVLHAFRCVQNRNLLRGILLDRKRHGLIERQAHGRRRRWQRLLGAHARNTEQPEDQDIENEGRPFAALGRSLDALVGLRNLVHDRLVEAALGQKIRAEAVHLAQQSFAGTVDITDPAKIDTEFLFRVRCAQLAPALLKSGHVRASDLSFQSKESLSPFVDRSYTKHS
jgi:hypothetical protein